MKLFIDTLDLKDIKRFVDMGIIEGITTNPTFMQKWGYNSSEDMIEAIQSVFPQGEIHVEVFERSTQQIITRARYLNSKYKNLVFKIPFTYWGLRAVKQLESEGVKCNIHLIFSANQALLANAVNATYICPLIGRLDDIGGDGMELIAEINDMGLDTRIMVSSVRHPKHVQLAAEYCVDTATIPPAVLDKMLIHPLTEKGIDAFAQ